MYEPKLSTTAHRTKEWLVAMSIIDSWQFFVTHLRARLGADERGASLVEYALLVALIAVICIVAIAFLGQSASSKFSTVGSSIGT
jgi:pilus assembly protein Flp/PilA